MLVFCASGEIREGGVRAACCFRHPRGAPGKTPGDDGLLPDSALLAGLRQGCFLSFGEASLGEHGHPRFFVPSRAAWGLPPLVYTCLRRLHRDGG